MTAPSSPTVTALGTLATVAWTYALDAVNVDEFDIQYTAKNSVGSTLGQSENFLKSYFSTITSYTQNISVDTICSDYSADHIDFLIQATPIDTSKNSVSSWVSAGSVDCSGICKADGLGMPCHQN